MVAGWKHTFKLRIDLDQSCKNREKNRLPAPKLLGPEGAVGIRASGERDCTLIVRVRVAELVHRHHGNVERHA